MSNISKRIALLRMLMICGVVLLHVPPYVPISAAGDGWFDFIKAFFQSAVFRCTVPVLSLISGFLLFNANLDQSPGRLWVKKWRTLAIPFFVFNTVLAVVAYLLQSIRPLPISVQLVPFDALVMLDAAFGVRQSPINYPLNFLRDIFVLTMLAPLMGWLLRRATLFGLAVVVLVFRFNLDGYLILRWDMAVLFYVGGMAALNNWDLRRLDKYAGLCLAIFIALCITVVLARVADTTYLRLVAPLLIWPASALLVNTQIGAWLCRTSKYSYFIFLAHGPVLLITWLGYQQAGKFIPYEIYWIGAPVITIAFLMGVHILGNALMPHIFSTLTGAARSKELDAGTDRVIRESSVRSKA